jgi:hypothetical protein
MTLAGSWGLRKTTRKSHAVSSGHARSRQRRTHSRSFAFALLPPPLPSFPPLSACLPQACLLAPFACSFLFLFPFLVSGARHQRRAALLATKTNQTARSPNTKLNTARDRKQENEQKQKRQKEELSMHWTARGQRPGHSSTGEAGPQREGSSELDRRWKNTSGGLIIAFLRLKFTASKRT